MIASTKPSALAFKRLFDIIVSGSRSSFALATDHFDLAGDQVG